MQDTTVSFLEMWQPELCVALQMWLHHLFVQRHCINTGHCILNPVCNGPYLSEAVPGVLQDFQGIVGSLAFAVELYVASETFQFYLSKRG